MSSSWRGAALWASLFLLMFGVGIFAERAFVGNRGGMTVDIFDTTTTPAAPVLETTITVGTGPIDIASDMPDADGPVQLFVANSGSNSISVIDPFKNTAFSTITGGGLFGAFDTPSGVVRMQDPRPVPLIRPTIAVVDQAVTPPSYGGAGRSTIRFISPTSHFVVDAMREASPTARYSDVVWTDNMRLWVADQGDKGVTVVRFPSTITGPPFFMGNTLIYQGTAEFADFVRDTATTPGFLLSPRRLATDGTNYVVVADGGSAVVTILEATYFPSNLLGEPNAILANVTLPVAAGTVCVDVEVIGAIAYVTTSNGTGANLHRINLATQTYMGAITLPAAGGFIGGLGATADGTKLYAGDAAGSLLHEVDVATFTETAPGFTFGGAMPWAFYSSDPNLNPPSIPSGPPPSGGGGGGGSSSSGKEGCGLLGLEALALLGLGLLRRRA